MSTVVKALSLFEHFDSSASEIGLIDMARLSGLDKATTRRLLVALATKGFIEQDPVTRRYRLGAALVRLARIREAAVPFLELARPVVEALSQQSGETVHISQIAGGILSSLLVCESQQANRVSVAVGQKLPFNCTASGVAFLSAASESVRAALLKGPLVRMTKHSVMTLAQLKKRIEEARKRGYAQSNEGFDYGVISVGSPIIGADGAPVGALSITCPSSRADQTTIARHGAKVRTAAAQISSLLGSRMAAA